MTGRNDQRNSKTLDQERAAYAWARVQAAKRTLKGSFESYVNLAKAAPALIMQNGLMQTLAFYEGKSEQHHAALLEDIATWVCQRMRWPTSGDIYSIVMQGLHGFSGLDYMRATREALDVLKWIRQFAAAAHKGG